MYITQLEVNNVWQVAFDRMETDSFFYQLLKQLPETLFELLGLPPERARSYRFDSVELKKALRIDGLFLPNRRSLPLYFVEVQFQPVAKFYANLFAKVFSYLDENDPGQDWKAVAISPAERLSRCGSFRTRSSWSPTGSYGSTWMSFRCRLHLRSD
jgi:Protein of unknown function (DUF2887)